jgi:hypothetical protein
MYLYLSSTLFFYLSYLGLDKYGDDFFPNTTEIVTKKYRIVNSVKSVALAGLCFPGTTFLYNMVYFPTNILWDELNMLGAVYAATDISALLYNRKCHTSTIIHHIVVQLFYFYCYFMEFNMKYGVVRGIGIYCVLSSYAFLVNGRLALRFISNKQLEYYVNDTSLYIYITSCVINWIIQSYILLTSSVGGMDMEIHIVERLVYMIALGMTINDDIFLINFLRKIDYN